MFCENCGKELIGNIRFCPECGTEIRIPYTYEETSENSEQNFKFSQKTEPFVFKKKVSTRRKNIVTSQVERLGYNYNFGHFLAVIGAALEVLSLFLPNKKIINNGISMLEYLKLFVEQLVEKLFSEPETELVTYISVAILVYYFIMLFTSCIQLNTDVLLMYSIINLAAVGYTTYQFNKFSVNYEKISDKLHYTMNAIQGTGYWLFLVSGIIIFGSAIIAKMLSSNEKSKTSSKTI